MGRYTVPGLVIGWFQVAYADELAPGEIRALRYFARDLVLWRDPGGHPVLTDAHCPHLGAHFAFGGTATAQGLTCPMHAWRFSGDGRCVDPPVPQRLRTYPTIERNGMVLAWFHPDDEPPAWEIPYRGDIVAGTFIELSRHTWQGRTIWQEVAENMVDVGHVHTLHGLEHYTKHEMTEDGVRRHISMTQPFRTSMGAIELTMEFDVHGPGYVIARVGGNLDLVQTFTPVDDEVLDIRFTFFGRDLGSLRRTERIAAPLVDDLVRQTEQHLPIWENKAYITDPPLQPGDGPITRFRAWAEQFQVKRPG